MVRWVATAHSLNASVVYEIPAVDVAVIFGNDQMEIFNETLSPAFAVTWGDQIANDELAPARYATLPAGVKEAILRTRLASSIAG